jgi:hypothetical protein
MGNQEMFFCNVFAEIVIAPPLVYLDRVNQLLNDQQLIQVSAQNCYHESKGAFTGEVSADMLKDVGNVWQMRTAKCTNINCCISHALSTVPIVSQHSCRFHT